MKPIQPDNLSRAERSALRRLRDQVRQEKRERSKPVHKPDELRKEEKTKV